MTKGSHQYFSPPQGRGLFGKELVLCLGAKKKKVQYGLEYFIASKAASPGSGLVKGTQEPS